MILGASFVRLVIDNGAIDDEGNRSRVEYTAVATNFGLGFNLAASRNLWLSTRFGIRRYWINGVNVKDDYHGIDQLKPGGLWITMGLYAGVGIK